MVAADTLAGDKITQRLTAAPGNGASIGGLKIMTDYGWFAARLHQGQKKHTKFIVKVSVAKNIYALLKKKLSRSLVK